MNFYKFARGAALALLLACPVGLATAQTDEQATRQQLDQLQVKIRQVNREIASAQTRKNKLQVQLREAEVSLGKLLKTIGENETALAKTQARLVELEKQRDQLEHARDQQKSLIGEELNAAYRMGRQGQAKVLLNQDDPHTLARALTYYRYIFDARQQHIDQYRQTLRQLATVSEDIINTAAQLANTQATLQQQRQKLVSAQRNRELAVNQLSASIRDKGGELQEMEQSRKELERLLQTIEEAVVNLTLPDNYKPFSQAKGQMPWPISGRASHRFGKPRNAGKMRWQGVTIPAVQGTTVKAIHHGRVVYADWFRGSGLLLIIDHGDGYMSLYAHNQSLVREVGEWVSADTPISTVGNSGGLESAALYFEIRHKGKPTNPASWCRR